MKHFIGIDLGGTQIKMGLVRGEEIIARRDIMARSAEGIAIHLPLLEEAINSMMTQTGVEKIDGVGLTFPGLVDVRKKEVTATYGKYDDAKDIDLSAWVFSRWGCPYFMDNDTRMATVGEWQYGAGKGYDNVVMMTLGTGIGTSVIMEGRIVRGAHFQAGCLGGHFIIDLEGMDCSCGGKGCVEAHSASWSVDKQVKNSPDRDKSLLAGYDKVGYLELFEAARKGDALALRIKQHSLHVWAAGITSLIHAYDPEVVVMGGAVMKSSHEVLPFVQSFVDRYANTAWGKVKVLSSQLMNDAAIMGVVYCLQHEA